MKKPPQLEELEQELAALRDYLNSLNERLKRLEDRDAVCNVRPDDMPLKNQQWLDEIVRKEIEKLGLKF